MIINNVIPNKLHKELIDVGIECNVSHNVKDGRYFVGECKIKFHENTDMDLVQRIIRSHVPIPLGEPKTEIEKLKISQAEQFETVLELLGGM